MKKLVMIFLVLAIVVITGIAANQGWIAGLNQDGPEIREKSQQFIECLKFKRYTDAALFHHPSDREKADIRKLIKNIFRIPPEKLEVQQHIVVFAEIDSRGDGGRSKNRIMVKMLNTGEDGRREHEVMLYWRKIDDEWWLKLHESLR